MVFLQEQRNFIQQFKFYTFLINSPKAKSHEQVHIDSEWLQSVYPKYPQLPALNGLTYSIHLPN